MRCENDFRKDGEIGWGEKKEISIASSRFDRRVHWSYSTNNTSVRAAVTTIKIHKLILGTFSNVYIANALMRSLKTRKWKKIEGMYPNINRAAQAPPLVAVVDNQLYAVEYLTNMINKYDREKNSWDALGRLPVRADSSNGWGLAFKACGEALLVVGGQMAPEGEAIVLNSWYPKSGVKNRTLDWKVLGVKEHAGVFVYNCAVVGC
ncbi:F-box/kelch-repeat protein At5g60570-like [Olea europaea var. sylvestris]|uniref:F-box/kelch-repeat protein At5g60570-like n=1 Tax=Olea europaea var. sylvestris TaxID=158386 RepID=UPI000C1D83DF|nr:F-box/kelch-repeat protein At5g60570-like [Olea europaea var. sylvestris]